MLLASVLVSVAGTGAAQAKVSGPNGRIVFTALGKHIPGDRGPEGRATFTVNPDGSRLQKVVPGDGCLPYPHWSPDGTEISVQAEPCPTRTFCSVTIVNPDSRTFGDLPVPSPVSDWDLGFACSVWSPDGSRLACIGSSTIDPSLDGIYTVRSSDGGDVTLVTSIAIENFPGDFSPDGARLVFAHHDPETDETVLFVVDLGDGGLTQITPAGMVLNPENGGSWSPTGDRIVFEARSAPDQRFSIWTVGSDGQGLQQVPISGCGGAISDPASVGCHHPSWSPDGTKIALDRLGSICTVNTDGSGLFQVTRSSNRAEFPDWGPHPLAG
jgi:Tol biopolymer transport system component